MTTILPALAVAFTAFCVWLTVRIVNRRERWAKWTAVAVVGMPALYIATFGPASWWLSTPVKLDFVGIKSQRPPSIYAPIGIVSRWFGPGQIQDAICWYATLCVPKGEGVACGVQHLGDPGIVFIAH
jgi:hypothetical protein